MDNAENIAWEAAPAGTDMTLGVDASEILQFSGALNATAMTEATIGVVNLGEIDTYSELNAIVADVTLTHNGLIDTYAEINAIVADVTLTHNGLIDTLAELETIMASINILAETEIDASSELIALMDDEVGTGLLTFATSPVFTTNIDVVATGVRFSAADGVLTLLGLGNGFDEDLSLDLDNITNVGTFSSSTLLATLNFSGIALQESGIGVLNADEIDASSELLTLMDDETGTGLLVFGTSPTFTTDIVFPALSIEAGAYGAATIDGDDIASGLAGRSLTLTAASPDTLDADAELYTDTKCAWWESPVATDDFKSIWFAKQAATLTSIWAESDQTVTFMLQVDDGTPADVDTVDLAPAAGTAEDTSLDGDATMAAGERLDMAVTSVANTPTWVSVCWTFTYSD